ncbi:MAG: hypothetical protein AAB554_03145 [Patescibacteria group bacterium]
MDLIKLDLKELSFRERLRQAEWQAITKRRAAQSDALRSVTGMLASGTVIVAGGCAMIGATFAIAAVHVFLAALVFITGFSGTVAAFVVTFLHYLEPSDRKLLPYLLEPQARRFFLATADRRERLLEDAEAFDLALDVFKGLPERAGDEVNEGVAANFSERRARHAAEEEAYLSELAAATVDDRARVAALEAARKKPRTPRNRELSEFADQVRQLAWVERSLDGLDSSVEAGMTVELSPYVAAQRLRGELEEERAALVARGLKPKRLPKPRIAARKLLPTST